MMHFLRDILWSGAGILLLTGFGIYFTFAFRFIQLRPRHILRSTILAEDGKSAARSFVTALGGTVGAGSITGVALGIAVGGAGSIFWMWVSGFFGMALRYAETKAVHGDTVDICGRRIGGAMVSLSKLGKSGAAKMFCFMTLAVSLCTGCLAQSNAAAASYECRTVVGILLAAIFIITVIRGSEGIIKLSNIIMPLCCFTYIAMLCIILCRNLSSLPDAFCRIFTEAFSLKAMAGGSTAGMLIAMREGFSRGVFSNESGMGSAPLAYASADAAPEWGVLEIFADTFIISTLSALCLLSADANSMYDMFLSHFGMAGVHILGVLMCCFALASMLCWNMYGRTVLEYMKAGKALLTAYAVVSAAVVLLGAVVNQQSAWYIADIFNLLMILPNLYLLTLKGKSIYDCNKIHGTKRGRGRKATESRR